MVGISDFVRDTLAYLSNCAIALLTLIGWALRLRPIKGALRCKVRSERAPNETPDSRVILFIACSLFGIVLTYAFGGFTATATAIVRAAVGATALPKVAIITSVLFYLTCERAIAKATSRAIAPGRRGRRNRHVLRFLVASLLVQIAIYEPVVVLLLGNIPDTSWFRLTGEPLSTIGGFYDLLIMLLRLIPLLLPFFYLYAVLGKSKSLLRGEEVPRGLATLPVDLIGAGLAASLLSALLYPPVTPKLVSLRCRAVMGRELDEVHINALFRNDGEQYWTPQVNLKINLLGKPIYDPFAKKETRFRTSAENWAPLQAGEGPDQLLIGPHRELRFLRHVTFPKGYIGPGEDTNCSLSNTMPQISFFRLFEREVPDEELAWVAITPADLKTGEIEFDMTNATDDDRNAAATP